MSWVLSRGFYTARSQYALPSRRAGGLQIRLLTHKTCLSRQKDTNRQINEMMKHEKEEEANGWAGGAENSAKPVCKVLAVQGSPGVKRGGVSLDLGTNYIKLIVVKHTQGF